MATTNINIRMDSALKQEAEMIAVLDEYHERSVHLLIESQQIH